MTARSLTATQAQVETGQALLTRQCLGLDALIRVKRAAGRPKDFEAIAELER